MNLSFKHFQFSSVKFVRKNLKYHSGDIKFNNHFSDHKLAEDTYNTAMECMLNFRSIRDAEELKEKINKNQFINKHSAFKQSNDDLEPALVVLQKYGFSREFIITNIFDGYLSENLGTDNEVREKFSNAGFLLKIDIGVNSRKNISKTRLICYVKMNTVFPLFIDTNHSLYYDSPTISRSNNELEIIYKRVLFNFRF